MAWANQRLYAAVQTLPAAALTCAVTDPDFHVAQILQHIVSGAEWYCHCANGYQWFERIVPTTMADVATLAAQLAELDAIILAEVERDDVVLSFEDEYGAKTAWLSTVLAQAVHHADEHRAQLVAALDLHGHRALSLDDIDLWAFESHQRSHS